MSTTAADQLKRLLTLIPHLADGEERPLSDVATIIGTSADQIIDDLRSLVERYDVPGGFVDGVQIYHEGDKVSVVTQHFRRPMRLTMSELCALELGLSIVRTERAANDVAAVDRALALLRGVITNIPGDDRKTDLATGNVEPSGVSTDHLTALRLAIRERRKSRILYRRSSAAGAEERTICPYSLAFVSGMWYVVAHCEKAAALRVFRLDRITRVEGRGDAYEIPNDFSVDRVLESAKALMPSAEAEKLVVRYSPAIAKWIAEREGVELAGDGSVIVEHPLMDDDWAVRHTLQYGPEAEVLAPERVREMIAQALIPK